MAANSNQYQFKLFHVQHHMMEGLNMMLGRIKDNTGTRRFSSLNPRKSNYENYDY